MGIAGELHHIQPEGLQAHSDTLFCLFNLLFSLRLVKVSLLVSKILPVLSAVLLSFTIFYSLTYFPLLRLYFFLEE